MSEGGEANNVRRVVGADFEKHRENRVDGPLQACFSSYVDLLQHPVFRVELLGIDGELGWDEMGLVPTVARRAPPHDLIGHFRFRFEKLFRNDRGMSIKTSHEEVARAIDFVARLNGYHPVLDYLEGLVGKWDGQERINHIPTDILGSKPSALASVLIRRWLVSAVRRIFKPGCEAHGMLILVGPQYAGKSAFFGILGGEWRNSTPPNFKNEQRLAMSLRASWIVECAELSTFRKTDLETLKNQLTSPIDSVVLPYGKYQEKFPRMSVFGGNTNELQFLIDTTGNRRFWPVEVGTATGGRIDIEALKRDRSQIWAEAVHLHFQGEPNQISKEELAELNEHNKAHQVEEDWDGIVESAAWEWLNSGQDVTVDRLLEIAIGKPPKDWRYDRNKVSNALRRIGWSRTDKIRLGGGRRTRLWFPDGDPRLLER